MHTFRTTFRCTDAQILAQGIFFFFLHELLIQLMLETFTNTGILPGTSDGGISLGQPEIPLAGLIGIQHGCPWIKPCVGPPMHT